MHPNLEKPEYKTAGASAAHDKTGMHDHVPFAHMDHHFHTAMNGLIGMLALLEDTELTSAQKEFLINAKTNAEGLIAHFEDMFDLSRIATSVFTLQHKPFDFRKLFQNLESKYFYALPQKKAYLSLQMDSECGLFLVGDGASLHRALEILLENAFSWKHGTPRMEVRGDPQSNGRLRLDIFIMSGEFNSRNGILMQIFSDAKNLNFSGAHHDSAHCIKLILCKKLIASMGGAITMETHLTHGDSLRLVLELPMAALGLAAIRIMLVGEPSAIMSACEDRMRQHAIRVDHFSSAVTALQSLAIASTAHEPYQIAVINHRLTDIDGEALGAMIKADSIHKDTLLLMLGAPSAISDASRLEQAGFSALVSDPIEPQTLIDSLAYLSVFIKERKLPPFILNATPFAAFSSNSTMSFEGYRALVVDDNVVNCQIAIHMLRKLGFQTDFASNGQQAVSMHTRHAYDLILMDCHMPVLDGFQATELIRAMEKGNERTSIIAWTANTLQDERAKCLQSGMDDMLPKPTRHQDLQEKLAYWLLPSSDTSVAMPDARDKDELEIMQELFGDHFTELARLYQEDTKKRIAALRDAIESKNANSIEKHAHTLRGSCSSIGAIHLASLFQELQIRCKAGLFDDFNSKMQDIHSEYNRIQTKLQVMMREDTL